MASLESRDNRTQEHLNLNERCEHMLNSRREHIWEGLTTEQSRDDVGSPLFRVCNCDDVRFTHNYSMVGLTFVGNRNRKIAQLGQSSLRCCLEQVWKYYSWSRSSRHSSQFRLDATTLGVLRMHSPFQTDNGLDSSELPIESRTVWIFITLGRTRYALGPALPKVLSLSYFSSQTCEGGKVPVFLPFSATRMIRVLEIVLPFATANRLSIQSHFPFCFFFSPAERALREFHIHFHYPPFLLMPRSDCEKSTETFKQKNNISRNS